MGVSHLSTLYTIHCTLYTVHCILFTVHCLMYIGHCTLYTVHCTLYTVYCILCTVLCPLSTVNCPLRPQVTVSLTEEVLLGGEQKIPVDLGVLERSDKLEMNDSNIGDNAVVTGKEKKKCAIM